MHDSETRNIDFMSIRNRREVGYNLLLYLVGSVKVNILSYRYRADKSTIFGMRGLWVLTINSGRGATLKYL